MSGRLERLRSGLEASGARAAEVLDSLEESDLECSATPEWVVRDLLVHLATSERGLQGVLEGFLRGESIVPEDFDLDRWNASQVARLRDLSLDRLRERILTSRQATLALLDRLTDADLDRRGRHALGREVSLGEALLIMAAHERVHIEEANYAVLRVGRA
jgi:DinB superfamily